MAGRFKSTTALLAGLMLAVMLLTSCGGKKSKMPDLAQSAAPDKELFEAAEKNIKGGRHIEGRLLLQTLINSYPDSEYLAKAKLAIADSYFKEGGTAGLLQSVNEYNDFKTFFPFLPEAAYAQKQIGMAHYMRLEKPDRDRSAAKSAEDEFQKFLLQYPDHELAPDVKQRLREVQEILAEGDYRIARFYFIKGAHKASAVRLLELTGRYPLYSQSDRALWMLAQIYEGNEPFRQFAAPVYAWLVREYPLSELAPEAKARLEAVGQPVPQPNPVALARMQAERDAPRERPGFLGRTWGLISSKPNVHTASLTGEPQMNPPSDLIPTDLFQPVKATGPVGEAQSAGNGQTGTGTDVTAKIVNRPAGSSPPNAPPAANPPTNTGSGTGTTPPTTKPAENTSGTSGSAGNVPVPDKNVGKKGKKDEKKDEKESSSKKKKGIRKVIPW